MGRGILEWAQGAKAGFAKNDSHGARANFVKKDAFQKVKGDYSKLVQRAQRLIAPKASGPYRSKSSKSRRESPKCLERNNGK